VAALERPTKGGNSTDAASIAPASWRAAGPYPDPNHAPASSHALAAHVASHVASHAPSSHAPSSHAGRAETDRQRNARLAMTARGHAPAASLAGHKLLLDGHKLLDGRAPASHAPASHSHAAAHDGLGPAPDSHAPASPAPPPMLSSWPLGTEQLPLAWLFCLVFVAGLVVGRLIKGSALPSNQP